MGSAAPAPENPDTCPRRAQVTTVPLAELLHALPFLVLVGMLPGAALATLVVPGWRRWERLAMAPGLSAGMAGVIGLAYHDLHVPFMAATVLPLEGMVVIAALWRARRKVAVVPTAHARPAGTRLVVAGALGAGVVSAALLVAGYRDLPIPVATDGPVHAAVAAGIIAQHDILPVLADPSAGSWVRPRAGFEATGALASEIGGPSAPAEQLPLTVLAVLLLPLGLAALALETTGSRAMAAAAPLLGVGWAFPSVAISFGELPYVVDATLVAPLVIAAVRALRPGELRRHLVLIATLVAAVWAVHGLEAITAVVIAAPLCAARAWPDRRRALPRLVGVLGASLGGAALVTLITRMPALTPHATGGVARATSTEISRFSRDVGSTGLLDTLNAFAHYAFPSALVMGAYLLGVIAALMERRLRWALVAHAVLLACLVDVLSTGLLRRLWVALYPWSVQDRLPAVQYWVVPLLMALGVVWLGSRLSLGLAGSRARAGALFLGVVALVACAVDAPHDAKVYSASVQERGVVTADDRSVIDRLSRRLPAGSVVLTDGIADSGQWLAVLSMDIPYYTSNYVKDHPNDPRLVALEDACAHPVAAAAMLQGVDAVFVGSRHIYRPQHPWSAACIASIPGLETVATAGSGDGTAAAFLVRHPVAERPNNG
jgi:hypothetical protein